MRLGTSLAFFLFGFYLALKLMVDWGLPFYIRALLTIPLGASGFMIAINVGHMCSHMPFLHTPKLNYVLGWFSWDFCLGLSYDIWLHEHVVGHHQYTNIITIDPNCPESFGPDALYRGSWHQKWFKHYAYQVFWLPFVSFLLVKENRFACLRYWSKGLRKDVRVNAHYLGTSSKLFFLIGKICFYFRMYFWPWYAWNAPWYEILFMVQVTEIVAGYVVGTIFPANHITSEAVWPLIRTDEKGQRWIDAEWGIMQMEVTKDYSFDNKFLSFIFGNLNNHTAHHMYPGMHHGHYQDIAPIIRQIAREYKIKIHSTETFAEFIYLYFRHLWNLGYETQKDL
jgi:fatty acid desaturase